MQQVCGLLNAHGYLAEAAAIVSAEFAGQQVRDAIADGVQCIFACGGDGTIHDVLQGLVEDTGQLARRPVLGIISMGSANALARHLGLSMKPLEAARQQMNFVPRDIPVGRIECDGKHRYFIVMVGAGPAGSLVYKMLGKSKQRLGRAAYYLRAAHLFASRGFSSFDLQFTESGRHQSHTIRAVSALAVRVDDLGGLFSGLARDAQVHHPHLQLIAARPPGWLSLPLWFLMGWLRVNRFNPLVHIANVDNFTCKLSGSNRVHTQADGEWIGLAPMRVTLLPNAVRLLMSSPRAETASSEPDGIEP